VVDGTQPEKRRHETGINYVLVGKPLETKVYMYFNPSKWFLCVEYGEKSISKYFVSKCFYSIGEAA